MIKIYRTIILTVVCVGVKIGQIFNKRPPSSHCLRTLETVSPVIKLWKGNGGTIFMAWENAF